MRLGYARVSTADQNLDLQRKALAEAGCEKVYAEKISGTLTSRPALDQLLKEARKGDTIVVYKLDRLGRSVKHLLQLVEDLKGMGINLVSLKDNLETETPAGKLFFTIMGALAEFERELIRERATAGLEAARQRGVLVGRKPGLTPEAEQTARAVKSMAIDGHRPREIARTLGISPTTVYKYLEVELPKKRQPVKQ